MSRYSFWGRAVDQFGNIQPSVGISIYLAGTNTAAVIYTDQTGGTGISTAPQITTDGNGRFNFWVDDADYSTAQLFDIVVRGLKYTKVDIFRAGNINDLVTSLRAHLASASVHFLNPSAASLEQDNRINERIDQLISSGLSGATVEYVDEQISIIDNRITSEFNNLTLPTSASQEDILSVSAASREQDNRLWERVELIDPEAESVSAASREQDNRVREYAASLESPSANIINRATEYTDVLRVDVEDVDGQLASHLASADVHFTQSEIDFADIGVSAHAHPRYDTIDVSSVSAASREQDNRVREYAETLDSPSGNIINRAQEYTDVQILSVSAASVEQDNRLWEQISSVSAASLEKDNRLLQLITVSGGLGIYSQYEKFAIEMEMEFKAAQSSYYKELTYISGGPLDGSLFDIDIYTDSTKITQLFHKDLYYNLDSQLSRTLLTRLSDNSQVVKYLTYNADDKLESIEISAYNANQYSQFPPGGGGSTEVAALSAASREQDNRVREYAETLDSPSGNIINRAYEYSNLVSAASVEQDNRLWERIELIDPEAETVSAASKEADNRLKEELNDNITYEIHNITLPTSASQSDILSVSGSSKEQDNRLREYIDNIDLQTLISLLSVSAASDEKDQRLQDQIDGLEFTGTPSGSIYNRSIEYTDYNIHNLTLPTSASLNDLHYEISNLTLPTSASQDDLNDIRYDLNTFSSPNSASLDDLTYEIHNLTLPTSAGQEDILSVSAASREQDNRLTEDIEDVDNQLMTHLLSGGIHLDKRREEVIYAEWTFTSGASARFIDFPSTMYDYPDTVPEYKEGRVWYDAGLNALSFYNDVSEMAVQLGRELIIPVKNSTGSTINRGTVCYISGSTGQRALIQKADATDHFKSINVGLANNTMDDTEEGYILIRGQLKKLDTSGFAAGDRLWIHPTVLGALTNVEPAAPYQKTFIGTVVVSSAQTGWILVNPHSHGSIEDLANVDDKNPQEGYILQYYSASGAYAASDSLNLLQNKINTFSSPNSASQDDLRYEINNLTLPTSASQDDLTYAIHNLTLPTSASQDDLRYEINNLTLPLSASYEDVLTVSAASKESDNRIYETLHPADRIVDGDNIVRARDTDNVILISAGGMPVVSAGVGLKFWGDPNVDGTLWQRFGNLEVTRSGIKTSNNFVDGSGYGRIEHVSGTWQFTHDQNNGNVFFYTHLSNGTKNINLSFIPNGTGPSYTALYAGNTGVFNTFNNGADYGIWITAGGSAGALFTTRPGTDQLIIKNLEHGGHSTSGIYIKQADGAKIILLDESDSIIVSGAQTEIYGTPVKLKNDNVQTLSTTAGGIVVGYADRQVEMSFDNDAFFDFTNPVPDARFGFYGAGKTLLILDSDAGLTSYYGDSINFQGVSDGFRIQDPGTTQDFRIRYNNNAWNLFSVADHGNPIRFSSENGSGVEINLMILDPDNAVKLKNAGTQTLSTTAGGIVVGDGDRQASFLLSTGRDLIIRNNTAVGDVYLQVTDNTGSVDTVLRGAYNSSTYLYFNNSVRFLTQSAGVRITSDGGTTNSDIVFSGNDVYYRNEVNSGIFYIQAKDSAGTRHTLFSGNSGVASLYHQGTRSLSTTGSGIIVHSQGDILQKTYLVTDNGGDFIVHPNSITGSFIVSAHSGKQFETFGNGVRIYNALTGNALNLSMSSTNAQIHNESGASFEFKNSSNATIFYFQAADYRFYGSSTVNWVSLAQWPTVQDFRLKSVNPKGVFKIQSSDGPYVSLNDSTKTITLSANIIKLGGGHQELTVYKQIDGVQQGGIELHKGARIREISNDLTLDQSPSSAITERVFRTHILQASAGIRTQELIHTVGGEPTGFENQTDSVITFSDATSALNISGYAGGIYDYWIAGVNYPVDGSTPKSTAVIGQGINYFYLDTSGNLLVTQSFSSDVLLKDNTYVANVYWDNGNDKHIMLGDERHSIMWDWNIHGYHHLTEGTKYEDGLGLGDITAGGSGDLNTSAIVSCTQGHIRDEDIRLTITAVPVSGGASQDFTGGFPVFYREGADGDWKRQDPSPFPVINFVGGNGRLAWNEFTLGAWQQTEVGSGNIVLAHLFASNDQNIGNQVIAIQGQNEYTNIGDAEVGATTELLSLSQGDLPFVEFQPIGTLIYQTNNTYNNAVKGRIILTGDGSDYVDFRGFRGFTAGGTSVSEHGNLSGLDDDDHLQYANLDGSRNFTGTVGGLAGVSDTDFIIKSQLDSNILSVSAASKEQDNRLQEDIDSHTHPAGDISADRIQDGDNIVRSRDTDNTIMVSAGGNTAAHYFTDGVRFKSGGTQSLQVTGGGIVIGDADKQTEIIHQNTGDDLLIRNNVPDGNFQIDLRQGDDLAYNPVFYANPDAEVRLYYNGDDVLRTVSTGIYLYDSGGQRYDLNFSGSNFQLKSTVHGGITSILGENTAGTGITGLQFDPDAAVSLYYEGRNAINTIDGGLNFRNAENQTNSIFTGSEVANLNDLVLYSANNVTISAGTLQLSDGTNEPATIWFNTDDLYISNNDPDGWLFLTAEKSGGGQSTLLRGDPDGALYLNYAGNQTAFTRTGGFYLQDTSGNQGQVYVSAKALYIEKFGPESEIYLDARYIKFKAPVSNLTNEIFTGDEVANLGDLVLHSTNTITLSGDVNFTGSSNLSAASREQDNRLYEYVDAQTGSLQSDRITAGINIVRVREDSNTIQASANGTEVLNLSEHRQQIGPSGAATDSNFTIRTTHADLRLRDTQMIWAEWSGRQVDIGDPVFLNTQLGTNQFSILDGADSNRQYLVINTATKYAQLGGTGSDDVRVVVRNDPDGWVEGAWQATRLFRFKEEINNSNLPAFQLGSSQWIDTISNDDTLTAGPSAISTTESIKRYIDRSLAVSGGVILRGTESLASGITSAAVSYTEQIDENFTISTELINSIDNPPSIYSHIIIKKGLDEFRILFSGSLDSDNYRLDWAIIR